MTVSADSMALDQREARVRALTNYDPQHLTLEQVRLIKDTVAKGATDEELRLFIAVCGQTGLNPFTRQVHFVKRWDTAVGREVGTFQTGIDGYRLIAQRTGAYAGQSETKWCGEDGQWKEVWLSELPPAAAKVAVFRKGVDKPFWGVARWKAYHQTRKDGTPNSMWQRYDAEQLAKCAEALALRKAFPQELSGLYAHEEMTPAAVGVPFVAPEGAITMAEVGPPAAEPEPEQPAQAPPMTLEDLGKHSAMGISQEMFDKDMVATNYGAPSTVNEKATAPPPEVSDHDELFALLVLKSTDGKVYVKEKPVRSGKYRLVNEQAAADLGVQVDTLVAERGELVDLVLAGRLTAWLKAR